MKKAIAKILFDEGYIKNYELINDGLNARSSSRSRYTGGKTGTVIQGLKRISKPGLRVYAPSDALPKVWAAWASR